MFLELLQADPAYDEDDIDCYIHVAITIQAIGGRWKMLILWHLDKTARRYNELRRLIPGISQKMLTESLKALEQDGLVERKVYPEVPPRVEYKKTDHARSLEPIFDVMYEWGMKHRALLDGNTDK